MLRYTVEDHSVERSFSMSHPTHDTHAHIHDAQCGHLGVQHADHIDYLHDGHLHAAHEGHYDEHVVPVSATCAPVVCTTNHTGAPQVPHGDHVDTFIEGHLHHTHGDHCDDHGPLATI
jgi:hypothetical protein